MGLWNMECERRYERGCVFDLLSGTGYDLHSAQQLRPPELKRSRFEENEECRRNIQR